MNLEGFVSSTKKVSVRGPGVGLPSSPPPSGTDGGATATAGDLGHARRGLVLQDEALGRAEAPQSPIARPTSTHPHRGITEMILAWSTKRASGPRVRCPHPILEPTPLSSSQTTLSLSWDPNSASFSYFPSPGTLFPEGPQQVRGTGTPTAPCEYRPQDRKPLESRLCWSRLSGWLCGCGPAGDPSAPTSE